MHDLHPTCHENVPHPGQFEYYILANNKAFDINAIAPETLQRMYDDWPSGTGPNEEFWEHEWICHGTCSGMDIPTYFAAAIRVFESSANSREVMSCYTKDLSPIDCPDICPYEHNQLHRQSEAISASDAMMVGAKLLSASDAWENKGCPPQSGTCKPTGQEA
ncbi:hypothetical protein CVIRNUC_000295 [Coccomyxa viridis]|uniref:Uncharacterized protein n=1 Tax=Coccomyxa viridis TaxID=1274662 RepID=A0AAV1HRC0_9CHLO|nr:hypothetical protein CVIRNUC_000295 [Coccomyxa viridis]